MRLWLVALMVVWVCPVGAAEVLPPGVRALGQKVDVLEQRVAGVRARMEKMAAARKSEDEKLRQATVTLLRLRQYPKGFWLARSLVAGQPAAAGLTAMAARQNAAELALLDGKLGGLREVYGDANRQLDALHALEDAYGTARGRLSLAQRQALDEASLRADSLASQLEALGEVGKSEPLPPLADEQAREAKGSILRLPMAGKLVQGFRRAKGATAEGVVLQAAAGTPVSSVVDGEVLYSGPFRQFGGVVIVKSADTREDMVYGGLGTLTVETGQQVKAGDVVGSAADDGKLYWEVRKRGRTVDPLAAR
ncbi:MAG: peptidoglycan DD-metalloendopeptidase family protein [Proteobacteria bacterium]|nr:peptidoglycan DD-metalloendopeptidase family protein [Pseudomonadota bacterium]